MTQTRDTLYEFGVRGREVPICEPHESQILAERRAQQIADERGRSVKLRRRDDSIYAAPLFIAYPR